MTAPPAETRTYYAISVLSSRTNWTSVAEILAAIAVLPAFVAVIPLWVTPYLLMLSGVIHIMLRFITVRPVAMIAPGTTKAVDVPKLGPPDPPVVSD